MQFVVVNLMVVELVLTLAQFVYFLLLLVQEMAASDYALDLEDVFVTDFVLGSQEFA
jgi:hypothetical protein